MELGAPFEGWHYDEERETIYTLSGYRCTPEQIESALWLVGILRHETIAKHLMFADTPLVEPRPKIYDLRDFDRGEHISINVYRRREKAPCRKNRGVANAHVVRRSHR
jgi:hypothetical protein